MRSEMWSIDNHLYVESLSRLKNRSINSRSYVESVPFFRTNDENEKIITQSLTFKKLIGQQLVMSVASQQSSNTRFLDTIFLDRIVVASFVWKNGLTVMGFIEVRLKIASQISKTSCRYTASKWRWTIVQKATRGTLQIFVKSNGVFKYFVICIYCNR